MYIFLDIDGVLKPLPKGRFDTVPDHFDQDCLAHFENAIRPYENVQIVISSTWRLVLSLNAIRQLFSEDIQARVIGMTPETNGSVTPYERHQEVLLYLKQKEMVNTNWIAIDDQPEHYPAKCAVVLTEPTIGFNQASATTLQVLLEQLLN